MNRQVYERMFDIVHFNKGELKRNEWSRFNPLKRAMIGVFDSDYDFDNCVSMLIADKIIKFDNININYLNSEVEVVVS